MNERHVSDISDIYDVIDEDEVFLLGSRFARAVARSNARKAGITRLGDSWMEQASKKRRPKPYRDRSY